MIYAQPGSVMVEGHGVPGFERYRVVWLDPQEHVHMSDDNMLWGEAHVLADRLEHGEPYPYGPTDQENAQ